MKCYQVRSGETIIAEFDTQEEARAFISSVTYNNQAIGVVSSIPNYFTEYGLLNINKLEEFFKYDNMYSIAVNNMLYGSAMIGHKDFVDVVKRNGLLLSDGPSLGHTEVDKVGVIKSTEIDGVDIEDAQTYANATWYLNGYLLPLGKLSKKQKEIQRIYNEKVIPGFSLTSEETALLIKYKAFLTPRKLVFRDHFFVDKTSFNILSREFTSYLIEDTPEIRQEILNLWDSSRKQGISKEEYRSIISKIHNYYAPKLNLIDLHNMLNDMELKKTSYIIVDSAAKLLKPNIGQYKDGVYQYQQIELGRGSLRELVSTDSKLKDVVHGSQTQGLVFVEQDVDAELDTNISNKQSVVKIKSIINKYFNLKSKRQEFSGNELAGRLVNDDGSINKQEIVKLLETKSFKVKSEASVKELLSNPSVSLSNNFVSKDTMNAIMSELSKGLKQRVAGTSYTLASSAKVKVISDNQGRVIPSDKYHANPNKYGKVNTRALKFGNLDNNKNIYYSEVIVSQDILDKFGGNLSDINSEMLLGLGVRIPTEGKNSMVVIKIVDVLPRIYTGVVYAPNELVTYSGADFDIDKLFVRHYDVYTKGIEKIKYGSYLNLLSPETRLIKALEEYNAENKDNPLSIEEFNNRFGKTVESNYNAKSFLDIEPITKAELNNLLLDIEMLLAYNQYNKEQAEYPNSLNVWKQIILPYLQDNNLDDKSKKLLTGISSAVDKLIAKESIDVGGDNIGVAATFNIMYSLLNYYNIVTPYVLIDKQVAFADNTTIDLGTTELDSQGLTKNGEIRKTALIATLINMMTDNAKEQLAKDLYLDKNNLSGFLIGIGTGLDIKALTLIYNKEVQNRQLLDAFDNVDITNVVMYVIQTGDFPLENISNDEEANKSYYNVLGDKETLQTLDRYLSFLSAYTSQDMGKHLPLYLNNADANIYPDLNTTEFLTLNKLIINAYLFNTNKISNKLIQLNTIRSLIKGIDSDFKDLGKVYKAMSDLNISYTKEDSVLNTDLYKHIIIKGNNVYYRTQLGNNKVIKYTFESLSDIGNVAIQNQEIFALMANTVVFDNHIAKYAHLKRSTLIRQFIRPNIRRYTQLGETNQLEDALISNMNTRIYTNKISKYFRENPQSNYMIELFKPSMFYVKKQIEVDERTTTSEKHIVDLLRAKLLASPTYQDNLFLNQLDIRYLPSETRKDELLVAFLINTKSESKSKFKDSIVNDFRLLTRGVNPMDVITKIKQQGIDSLTDLEAANLLAVMMEAYSFVINGHSFKPNSVSMFLSPLVLQKLYSRLSEVETLINEYNDVPMNKKNSKDFNVKFKDITGRYFERFLLEFFHFEAANNGYGYYIPTKYRKHKMAKIFENKDYGYETKVSTTQLTHNNKQYKFRYASEINFKNAIKENDQEVIKGLQNYMRMYNNTRFLLYTTANDIKPAVFYPIIQTVTETKKTEQEVLSYVLTAEGKGNNIKYFEYYYDYTGTGKVFRREVDANNVPISNVEESLFMPITGYFAKYSKVTKYVDKELSNVLPFNMYVTNNDIVVGAFDGKEIIDGADSAIKEVGDTKQDEEIIDVQIEVESTTSTVTAEVKGENISSKGSEFAKKLTNLGNDLVVEYKGKIFRNAEHAYQTWKSGEFDQAAFESKAFKPVGRKEANKATNYQTMVEILTAKLQQHPELIEGINERGGLAYIEQSTHNVTGDKFWESTGQNKFIQALAEAYQLIQPTTPAVSNVEITKVNYTREEVKNNPNTAYVFTENTYSITAFPNKQGGGSAIIRPEPNAFAIVTKKKYDYNTKENVDYVDTAEDFKEFTEINTRLINELKNSSKSKIVFPQGFATDKAKMPTRFVEWLQKELLDNFGLITELNSAKTGLISKSVRSIQPTTEVEPIQEETKFDLGQYVKYENEIYIVTKITGTNTVQIYNPTKEGVDAKKNVALRNLTIVNSKAVIVNYPKTKIDYIVTPKNTIISLQTNKIQNWGEENGDRKAILELANKAKIAKEQSIDVIKPSTQALGGIEGIDEFIPPPTDQDFIEYEGDESNMSLLQPIEFINAILNKYQVNGRIPKSKELDVFNEVERYNKGLGYEAVTISEVSDTIKLTTNIEAQSRSKSSKETVINILNKLSNKFNIPYELDYNLPHKGMFVKGKVIVNPNLLTDDTPFHEFAHPFIAAIKRMNRPLYNQLITQIKQEKTILDRTDKLYRQLYVNKGLVGAQLENAIIEEAIVTAIGEYAADYNKLYNKSQGLLEAIKEFLSYIKQTIMDMFDKGSINIENIPNDVTLKELAVILASDIKVTNNTKINKEVLNILNQIDIC